MELRGRGVPVVLRTTESMCLRQRRFRLRGCGGSAAEDEGCDCKWKNADVREDDCVGDLTLSGPRHSADSEQHDLQA